MKNWRPPPSQSFLSLFLQKYSRNLLAEKSEGDFIMGPMVHDLGQDLTTATCNH